jgi:hypothetical protein
MKPEISALAETFFREKEGIGVHISATSLLSVSYLQPIMLIVLSRLLNTKYSTIHFKLRKNILDHCKACAYSQERDLSQETKWRERERPGRVIMQCDVDV